MTTTVTAVHKEISPNGTHKHIAEVCSDRGRFTRAQVIASLDAYQQWQTYGGGRNAPIKKIDRCPAIGCSVSPYIKTVADSYAPNNLDNLPAC